MGGKEAPNRIAVKIARDQGGMITTTSKSPLEA